MVQLWFWMVLALVAAVAVLYAVHRVERRDNPELPETGLRTFVNDFRAGWQDIRAERFARRHPDRAPNVASHLAPPVVDTQLDEVFEWSEPDDANRDWHDWRHAARG
ncbi:hypothetical protein ACFT5B_10295 [Luteimicrobium sp. NPDC057192]|uniref:hypothetical protein n=1 Tax=Luteimicrobium sp. NPDC057192 TaxID=3346042 RepID=UPI00362CE2EC